MDSTRTSVNTLLDPFVPAVSSWTLVTAARLGLFECLARGPLSPDEISDRLGIDREGIGRLLALLEHSGYLHKRGTRFALTPVARQTIGPDAHPSFINWLRFSRFQLMVLERLEHCVRSGEKIDMLALMQSPEDLEVWQLAMAETAVPIANWVAEQITLPPDAERMLDIGGSHGVYSSAVCRRHPGLKADILELEPVVNIARHVAENLGTSHHLNYLTGDIRSVRLERTYDAIFLSNLIHHLDPDQLNAVLGKIFAHLRRGGTIAVWDFVEQQGEIDAVTASFSLLFHITSGGRCYAESAIVDHLIKAGFTDVVTATPGGPTGHTLFVARA